MKPQIALEDQGLRHRVSKEIQKTQVYVPSKEKDLTGGQYLGNNSDEDSNSDNDIEKNVEKTPNTENNGNSENTSHTKFIKTISTDNLHKEIFEDTSSKQTEPGNTKTPETSKKLDTTE